MLAEVRTIGTIHGTRVLSLDASGVSRDPAVVAAYLADPLVYNGKIGARLGKEFMDAMDAAQAFGDGVVHLGWARADLAADCLGEARHQHAAAHGMNLLSGERALLDGYAQV